MVDSYFYKQPTMPDLISLHKTPVLPQLIGPYHVDSLLSKGGMSLLYLCSHPDYPQSIAVKVLSPSFVDHPEAVSRFLKESQMIMMANHPNVVKLYGQGEWEKGLYIAMEYIKGVSLRHYIVSESLSMRRALEIILQVAYALLHLHSHGIIHRDLKPENILMTDEGEIKVIDFGIAQLHHEPPLTLGGKDQVLGTPNYMSPEQKENSSEASFASDLYALGIILYELITGKLSYGVINLSLLPKGLKQIISKALAISISERYQDTSAFIHDISQYLNSEKIEQEKPESDQIKEIHECLQQALQSFSPVASPHWATLEVGIAIQKNSINTLSNKSRSSLPMGLYYDFFRFPNRTFLILMASSPVPSLAGIAYIGNLRGTIQMMLNQWPASKKFHPISFTNGLNTILCQDILKQPFALNLLFLDPAEDQLTYLSCGLGPLIHLPATLPRASSLALDNPMLGIDPSSAFSETQDNWNEGDLLLLHTFYTDPPFPESLLTSALEEHALLSAQRQADAILKTSATCLTPLLFPKAFITLHRL